MGDFYWKIAKSFKVLAIISLVSGITYGLVIMLLSFSSQRGTIILLGLLEFILCIIASIIGSAPLYVLGEVVDRIDGLENNVHKTKSNITNLRNTVNKINENTLPYKKQQGTKAETSFYSDDELRKMGLTSLKSLYEDGEISQATYERIKSEKMSNQ